MDIDWAFADILIRNSAFWWIWEIQQDTTRGWPRMEGYLFLPWTDVRSFQFDLVCRVRCLRCE